MGPFHADLKGFDEVSCGRRTGNGSHEAIHINPADQLRRESGSEPGLSYLAPKVFLKISLEALQPTSITMGQKYSSDSLLRGIERIANTSVHHRAPSSTSPATSLTRQGPHMQVNAPLHPSPSVYLCPFLPATTRMPPRQKRVP